MTVSGKRVRSVDAGEVRQFMGKAEDWLQVAQQALAAELFTPAAGSAIHSGINACDAICGARIRQRSAAENHSEAVKMLRTIPDVGSAAANHLQRLIQNKTEIEYDARPTTQKKAGAAVAHAESLVKIARSVVISALT